MRADTHDAVPPDVERELAAVDDALAGRPVDPDLADIAGLTRALRDERPEADPFFTQSLDQRARLGFSAEAGRDGRLGRWVRLRQWFVAKPMAIPGVAASMLLAILVSLALVNSVPTGGGQSDGDAGAGYVADEQTAPSGGSGGGQDATVQADTAASESQLEARRSAPKAPGRARDAAGGAGAAAPSMIAPPPPPGGGSPRSDRRARRVVETAASLTLATPADELQDKADAIVQQIDALGGFVVASAVNSTDGDSGSATFELRVPSKRLKSALAALSRIAHVRERQEATRDITAQHASARSRLADARAERKALLKQLGNASTQLEIDSLKSRLRDVGYRIRAARTDLARVNNRASFSNIAVTLVADEQAAADGGDYDGVWTPGDAARDALRVLEVAVGVLLVGLAVLAPLLLLALLAVPVVRRSTRRRRERALDAA